MFGTDWPVCLLRLNSYQQWATMMRSFIASLSAAEQENILTNNAIRCYDL
jgi:predicted TIM-barrel fold metal-dependent hydrolase